MAWPTPQDFNESIQNPRLAFGDAELQAGQPELNQLGLPRPITGGFASVYRMQCGGRTWAVRCFLRERPDQEQRYTAISAHLARAHLPYTVGFRFLREGIRVRGQWYPILKMEWVQGASLSAYVAQHVNNPGALLGLADRWVQLVTALQQASVAHGDLQHGNVFVVGDDLRLLDYDGMYVPALNGLPSAELGHRNFQHPARTERTFGPRLDNFSAWVIYLSLIALSVDPGLWQRFQGGDECLLFRQDDFVHPDQSLLLRSLERGQDARLRSAAALLRSLLGFTPLKVPPLDGQPIPLAPPPSSIAASSHLPSSGGWLADHVARDAASASPAVEPERDSPSPTPSVADPAWILDLVARSAVTQVPAFANSARQERQALGLSTIALVVLLVATQLAGVPIVFVVAVSVILAIGNLVLWIHHYRQEPAVQELLAARAGLQRRHRDIRRINRAIERAEAQKQLGRRSGQAALAKLEERRQAIESRQRKELDAAQAWLQTALQAVARRRQAVDADELAALDKVQQNLGGKILQLNRRLQEINQSEQNEVATALRALQTRHVDEVLRSFTLANAPLYSIGEGLKEDLIRAGFRTAADIDYLRVQRVPNIGYQRASTLRDWKDLIVSKAQRSQPTSISDPDRASILARYERRRTSLVDERNAVQERLSDELETIRELHQAERQQLQREEADLRAQQQDQEQRIRAAYAPQFRALEAAVESANHDLETALGEVDRRVAQMTRDLFDLTWQRGKAEREVARHASVGFPEYVRRVVLDVE